MIKHSIFINFLLKKSLHFNQVIVNYRSLEKSKKLWKGARLMMTIQLINVNQFNRIKMNQPTPYPKVIIF